MVKYGKSRLKNITKERMESMKRLLSIILTISILLGSCGAAFAEEVSNVIAENLPEIIEEEILPEEIEEVTDEEFVSEEPIAEEELLPDEEISEDIIEVPSEEITEEPGEDLFEEFPEEIVEEELAEEPMEEETEPTPPVREYDQSVIDYINNNPINIGSSSDNNHMSTMGEITNSDNAELLEKDTEEINSTTSSGVTTRSTVPSEFKVDPVSSPYYEYINDSEGVSLATGAMTYNKTLLSLPGRNGLDLNVSVNYDSQSAVVTENEFDRITKDDIINYNNFAIGWSFGFASISRSGNSYGYNRYQTLNLENGESYIIGYSSDISDTEEKYTIYGYELTDMTLIKNTATNQYILTYPNGSKDYFDASFGYIVKREDVFGNKITFEYEDIYFFRGSFVDYVFNPSFYYAKLIALKKITDSTDKEVNFEYTMGNTLKGQKVNKIVISTDGVQCATINLDRVKSYNGHIDIVTDIVDGEDLKTTFEYEEDIAFIHNGDSYSVNGSNFMMTKVGFPTGGWAEYTYSKERRSYSYYVPSAIKIDWYEIYKVRTREDSLGNKIEYRYKGDYSGYPYSRLKTDLEWDNDQLNGNISDERVQYSTVVTDDHTETVHLFDYRHKKISEQSYAAENSMHKYVESRGNTSRNVVVNNQIYRLYNNRGKFALCKQGADDYEPFFLPPMPDKYISEIYAVKSQGSNICVFYETIPSSTEVRTYRARVFNTVTETWSDMKTYEDTVEYDVSKIYYGDGVFYLYGVYESGSSYYLKHLVFNPIDGGSWQTKEPKAVDVSELKLLMYSSNYNRNAYYYNNKTIYEYNPTTNTLTSKNFSFLSGNINYGFSYMGNNYISCGDKMYYLDFYYGTTGSAQSYPEGIYSHSAVHFNADGFVYFFGINKKDGKCPIYRMEPNPAGDFWWDLVGYRTFNDLSFYVFADYEYMYVSTERGRGNEYVYDNEDYYKECGFDRIRLYSGSDERVVQNEYTYNNKGQLESVLQRIYKGGVASTPAIQQYEYVSDKSAISSTTDVLDNVTKYEYNESDYYIPTSVTEFFGTDDAVTTTNTLSADKKRIESSITQYDGRSIKTEYLYCDDHPGNVISKSVSEIKGEDETPISTVEYEYDSDGLFVIREKVKNVVTNGDNFVLLPAEDYTTSYAYDNMGNLVSTTNAKGQTTAYTYNKNNWPLRTTYPDGTYVQNTYYLNGSNNRIVTSYNGQYQTIDYFDSLGRTIKQIESGGGRTATIAEYIYDGDRIERVKDANGNYTKYTYDPYGRVTTLRTYSKNDTLVDTQNVTYNDIGRSKTVNHGGKTKIQRFDIAGRLVREEQNTAAGLNYVDYTYDHRNNVTDADFANQTTVSNTYNDENQLVSTTNQIGQQTNYEYDKFGNVSKVTLPSGKTLLYSYDNAGRMISATDTAGVTEYYAYDKLGNLTRSKDKEGTVTTNTYNNMNRVTLNEAGTDVKGYVYDTLGNRITMMDGTGTTAYEYVLGSRLSKSTNPDGKTIEYTYDGVGNLTQVKDYNNKTVDYTYDALNRVTNVNAGSQGIDLNFTYTNFGTIGSVYNADYIKYYTYDNALRVTNETAQSQLNGQMYLDIDYTYDVLGNQTQKVDSSSGTDVVTNYTYDNLGRLTSEQFGDSTTTYTFDADNNISTKEVEYSAPTNVEDVYGVAVHLFDYSYDNGNRLLTENQILRSETGAQVTGARTFTYDANGNRLTETKSGFLGSGTKYYAYNARNQLTRYITENEVITTFGYNGDGARVSKTTNATTTKFYWDRGYVVNEATNGTINVTNFIGPQGIFGRKVGTTTADSFIKNAHGDVTDLTNRNVTYDYDAYGNLRTDNMTDSNPFRYCGEYQDKESGLIYLRNRYYDPTVGRFINEDPIKDGTNWYAYANNNPVMFVDPLGLAPGDVFETLDDAAIDAANYLLPQTHKNDEEMVALIYYTVGGYQYCETPNVDPNPKFAFQVYWDRTPLALVHTHVYYEVEHPNNILSNPQNTTGTDGNSDTNFTETTGVTIYGAMPTGELWKYIKGDNEVTGTIVTTDLVIDPKYSVYHQFKNTLLWPLLVNKYASSTNTEKNEDFKMDIIKARVNHPNSIYDMMKEVGIIE